MTEPDLSTRVGPLELPNPVLRKGKLAEAIGCDADSGTFNRALTKGVGDGVLTKDGYGLYGLAQPSLGVAD